MEYRLRGPEWKWARPDEKAVEQSTGKMTGLGLGGNCVALVGWGGAGSWMYFKCRAVRR